MDRGNLQMSKRIGILFFCGLAEILYGVLWIWRSCLFLKSAEASFLLKCILYLGIAVVCGIGIYTVCISRIPIPVPMRKSTMVVQFGTGHKVITGLVLIIAEPLLAVANLYHIYGKDLLQDIFACVLSVFMIGALSLLTMMMRNCKIYCKRDGNCLFISLTGKKTYFHLKEVHSLLYKVKRYEVTILLLNREGKKLAEMDLMQENADKLESILLIRYGAEMVRHQTIGDRSEYAETKEDICHWNEENNTWNNENVSIIKRGMGFISIGIAALYAIAYVGDGIFLSRRAVLLILGLAPLPYYIYCLFFSEIICWLDYPQYAREEWRKHHIVASWWKLAIIWGGVMLFFYKSWIPARVMDTWRWLAFDLLMVGILLGIGIVRMPRHLRTINQVLGLTLVLIAMCYPLSYSTAYFLGGPGQLETVRILDHENVYYERNGKHKGYITFGFEDGKTYRKNVEKVTYRGMYRAEQIETYVYDSFLGIRFIDLENYKKVE